MQLANCLTTFIKSYIDLGPANVAWDVYLKLIQSILKLHREINNLQA